jgi:hypothetical protein
MTICIAETNVLQIPTLYSQGFSEDAELITNRVEESRSRLQETNEFENSIHDTIIELYLLYDECKNDGWDGAEAMAVMEETFELAYRFLQLLPLGIETPSITVEPDGQIAFEWYRLPNRVLSVSIDPNGYLHFSALLGTHRNRYGTEPFGASLPIDISRLINQVTHQ